VQYASLVIDKPYRLVLYLKGALLTLSKDEMSFADGPVLKIRSNQWSEDPPVVRVVLDLVAGTRYQISSHATGLVVDIGSEAPSSSGPSTRGEASEPTKGPANLDRLENLGSRAPITLDLHDAEMPNVLRLLAKQNDLNIVASPEVKGTITVTLRDVTLREALDNILHANGYTYVLDGDVILVKPDGGFDLREKVTKVYRLKYIDAFKLEDAVRDILSKDARVKVFAGNFQSRSSREANPAAAVVSGTNANQPQGRSSTLIVTDLPTNIAQIDRLVEMLDVPAAQIMIEAKLIELAPTDNTKLGIDWTTTISTQVFYENELPSGTFQPYSAITDLPDTKLRYGKLTTSQFGAVLDFLRSHTDSKLLSNPRIIAMDNEESKISVGTTFPVPQINRGVGGQGDIVTFQYKDVDISLRVTPHIGEDRSITMYVNPVIEEVTGEVVIDKNRAPITSKRSVDTVVKVKDGETIVIGGLIKENIADTVNKVWLLGDVPLIGNLFRHRTKEKKQSDLLIFITPRIVEG